ncbi:transposase (fragment) [Burkholderia sp. 8Y]
MGSRAISRLPALLDDASQELPPRLVCILLRLHRRYGQLCEEIAQIEGELKLQLAEDDPGQRLLTIPGIGPMTASSLLAMAGDVHGFRRGRDFAASLGLVPRQHSTGGRATLLGISKRGDKHLRCLLVQGARAVMQQARRRTDALVIWLQALMQRRHSNAVACALANKMARIVWAILAKGGAYRAHPAVA